MASTVISTHIKKDYYDRISEQNRLTHLQFGLLFHFCSSLRSSEAVFQQNMSLSWSGIYKNKQWSQWYWSSIFLPSGVSEVKIYYRKELKKLVKKKINILLKTEVRIRSAKAPCWKSAKIPNLFNSSIVLSLFSAKEQAVRQFLHYNKSRRIQSNPASNWWTWRDKYPPNEQVFPRLKNLRLI